MHVVHAPGMAALAEMLARSPWDVLARGRVLKRARRRAVVLLDAGVVAKLHAAPRGLAEWLRSLLGPSRAKREWRTALELGARGVAAPVPLAAGEERRWGALGRSFFASAFIAGTRPLSDVLREGLGPGKRRELARALGRFVRDLHDRGVRHDDLHAGNVLLGEDGRLWLVDLDHVATGAALERDARLRNLALLALSFRKATRTDRHRFLRDYLGSDSRGEAIAWGRAVETAAAARLRRKWRTKDRRCRRDGTAFAPFADGAWTGWIRRELPRGEVALSRAARVHDTAWACEVRGIPAPRTIGLLQQRWLGIPLASIVVLEAARGEDLAAALSWRWGARRRELVAALGREVRRAHDLGLDHRALDAVVVLEQGGFSFAGLEAARVRPSVSLRARSRGLARLLGVLASRSEKARLLAAYEPDRERRRALTCGIRTACGFRA